MNYNKRTNLCHRRLDPIVLLSSIDVVDVQHIKTGSDKLCRRKAFMFCEPFSLKRTSEDLKDVTLCWFLFMIYTCIRIECESRVRHINTSQAYANTHQKDGRDGARE